MVVIWGANISIQKYLFATIGPGGFLFARYLVMPVAALLLLLNAGGGRLPRLERQDLVALARLGFVGHALHATIVCYGVHWSTAFSSAVISACGPVFTLLILRLQKVEHLSRQQVIGVAVSFAGVLLFLSDKLLAGSWRATGGDLVLLLAAVLFSYYTVAAKPLTMKLGAKAVMGWATLLGGPPVVLLTLHEAGAVEWTSLPPRLWAAFFWTVLVSAFLGWLVWAWVNVVRGVARTAPMMYLMPPVAGLSAWLLTDEQFSAVKIAGAIVALGGVALAQFAGRLGR